MAQENETRALRAEADALTEAATAEQVGRFLVELFGANNPAGQGLDWSPDITAREVLSAGRVRIATELKDQPQVRVRLLEELGSVYRRLGMFDESRELFEEALRLHNESDRPDKKVAAARVRSSIALISGQAGQLAEAGPLLIEALASLGAAEVANAEGDPEVFPDARTASRVSSLLGQLAFLQQKQGNYTQAQATARRALRIVEHHAEGTEGKEDELRDHAFTVRRNLVTILTLSDNHDQAIAEARTNLELHRENFGPDHPQTVEAEEVLGMSLLGADQFAAALPYLRHTVEMHAERYDDTHPSSIASLNNLALALRGAGELKEALEMAERCMELSSQRFGTNNRDHALQLHNVSAMLMSVGRYQAAEERSAQAQATLEALAAAYPANLTELSSPLMARSLALRGENLAKSLKRPADAIPMLERALEIEVGISGFPALSRADHINVLAICYIESGQLDEAEKHLLDLLELYREIHGPEHDLVARTLSNLAKIAIDRELFEDALEYTQSSHAILLKVLPEGHTVFGYTLQGMARSLIALERFEEAEPHLRECIEIRTKGLPAGHPLTAEAQAALANALVGLKQPEEAEALLSTALATFKAAYPADHPDVLKTQELLAELSSL